MGTVATITAELYQHHGSLIFNNYEVIWNEAGLSIILVIHFILTSVVSTAFQIHQNYLLEIGNMIAYCFSINR